MRERNDMSPLTLGLNICLWIVIVINMIILASNLRDRKKLNKLIDELGDKLDEADELVKSTKALNETLGKHQ